MDKTNFLVPRDASLLSRICSWVSIISLGHVIREWKHFFSAWCIVASSVTTSSLTASSPMTVLNSGTTGTEQHLFISWVQLLSKKIVSVYIFHVTHNNNIIKYTIVSANTFKSLWLHISTALRPSSGQHIHIQIKCLQCAYNMGSHNVYNCNVYCIWLTALPSKKYFISSIGLKPHKASKQVSAMASSGLWFGSL